MNDPSGVAGPGAAAAGGSARPRVERLLEKALERRLTTVVADAGFGKTTLLSSWAASRRCAWYAASSADVVLDDFARGLVAALRLRMPGLVPDIVTAIEGARGPDVAPERRAEAIAGLLASALSARPDVDVALVIDDADELGLSGPSWRLVESLCRQAPPTLHLVLASRSQPPFAIERLRGRGQVLELSGADLLLDLAETRALVSDRLGPASVELAVELHDATGGWPAAVRLAVEALQHMPAEERRAVLASLPEPGTPLAAYLAAEVFDAERPEVRDLLRAVAEFPRVTPELCLALGFQGARDDLAALARRGLLVRAEPTERWYAPSGLVRDFVREHVPLAEDGFRRLHRSAADWFELNGHGVDALRSLRAIDDLDGAARLLREHGTELLAGGAVDEVLAAARLLPTEPALERLQGDACRLRGDWDGALAHYGRAAGDAIALPPGLAYAIGLVHHVRGRLDDALAAYERGLLDGTDPRSEALLLAWRSAAHWLRAEKEPCRELAARSFAAATATADDQALAAAHTALAMVAALDADRTANEAHYARALEHAERAGDVLQVIRVRANRGSHYLEEGDYRAALPELDSAIRLANVSGWDFLRALALTNRGEVRLRLGQLEDAATDLALAKTLYETLGSRMVAYPLQKLGEVHLERGSAALARAAFEQALRESEAAGDLQGRVPSLVGLARVLAADEPELAFELAEQALSHGTGMAYVAALLASGSVALARGDLPAAVERARSAAAAARERRDRAGLADALELEALAAAEPAARRQRLAEARSVWHDVGDAVREARADVGLALLDGDAEALSRAERRLLSLGARGYPQAVVDLLSPGYRRPAAIAVETLGRFRVLREGRPVPLGEWKSKKARDLFKILVARRGRPVARDALIEALWPDEDPDRTGNRLSVALSTVRALLDPERRFERDWFVRAEQGVVALERERVSVDVEEFLTTAAEALDAWRRGPADEGRGRLAAAEARYAGDFLEEDVYEDWPVTLREEARTVYVAIARTLADDAAARGDHDAAARYALRILERDPYDEHAHVGLVAALAGARRHGDSRRAFEAYCARMEEIGIEPAPYPAAAADPRTSTSV